MCGSLFGAGMASPPPDREQTFMRLPSSFVASSSRAILATALLCALSGTARSQTATASANALPSITIDAPKQAARPHRPKPVANAAPSRRTSVASRGPSVASRGTSPDARTPAAAPDSVLGKLARLEKASSSCNDGCETSLKQGNAPWNGCSYSGGVNSAFSATCKDTLKYRSYADCRSTKLFLGWIQREAWWHCSGMAAGQRFQVAEARRRR
jgi:hypothetical protein